MMGIMAAHQIPEDCVDAVVEIPRGSRNKYEMDHESGIIRLDRRLFSATVYPADYGFVPDTLAEDGDPLDILVLLEDPTFPGCYVTARPVGMLAMDDEKGRDVKIIAVEPNEPRFRETFDLGDVQPELLEEIRNFFEMYKMLEPGKHAETGDFDDRAAAWAEIEACRHRYAESLGMQSS
jgi:inorganic pyrophosphatase